MIYWTDFYRIFTIW